jgi:hypothetical protein
MRLTLFVIIIAAAVLPARAEERPRYPFKSAVVVYKISGTIQEGTQTVFIDDHGRKMRTERDTALTILGRTQKESIVEIDDGEWIYRIDLVKKTAEKAPSYSRIAREMVGAMSPAQKTAFEEIGRELTRGHAVSGEVASKGKEKVLGRDCDLYEAMGMTTWLWNNLPLRKKSPSLGDMVQEAVELKVDVPIPPEKFLPPRGMKILDAGRVVDDIAPLR